MKYVASCSGGKDSVAMVLGLIEKDFPLDCVLMVDLGKEFNCIYRVWDKLCKVMDEHGVKHEQLKPEKPFDWHFAEREVRERKGGVHYGYSWCGGRVRWGTTMKRQLLEKFYADNYGSEPICEYVGIASDENDRAVIQRSANIKAYPLIMWGMTENDCLIKCYRSGFHWDENGRELYDYLERVSCYCCGNKNLRECKAVIRNFPEYWQKIKDMETRIGQPYKGLGTDVIEQKGVDDLEKQKEKTAAKKLKNAEISLF